MKNPPSLIIAGPSTTGKTEIAFRLAEELNGELINSDKFYLFKGFNSITGLPDFSILPKIKKHLYQILDPTDNLLSEDDFFTRAVNIEQEIILRGNTPIIEGCYHRFIKRLMDSERGYICVGIKWTSISDLENRVKERVEDIFHKHGGIEEVRNGIRNGWRDTYVMKKGSMIKPVVEYFDGLISLELAKEKAIADITYAALKAYRRFLDIQRITWIENDSTITQEVVKRIVNLVKNNNPE